MKYLKTFESKSVEKKFEPIGHEEWCDLVELAIDFPEREFKEVQSIYPDAKILPGQIRQYIRINTFSWGSSVSSEFLELNCIPDEWYLVWCESGYNYKCDQLDGLLDCLEFLKKEYISK